MRWCGLRFGRARVSAGHIFAAWPIFDAVKQGAGSIFLEADEIYLLPGTPHPQVSQLSRRDQFFHRIRENPIVRYRPMMPNDAMADRGACGANS